MPKFLYLSTEHISKPTQGYLNRVTEFTPEIISARMRSGWVVYANRKIDRRVPLDLRVCMQRAHKTGATYLMFDWDAPLHDGLPVLGRTGASEHPAPKRATQ